VSIVGGLILGVTSTLELSSKEIAILGIVVGAAGTLQTFLPKIQRPPDDARRGLD
jgi:hypothetical protein